MHEILNICLLLNLLMYILVHNSRIWLFLDSFSLFNISSVCSYQKLPYISFCIPEDF